MTPEIIVLILRIIMIIVLFGFVLFALITQWLTLKSTHYKNWKGRPLGLIVSNQEGEEIIENVFNKSDLIIGRDPNADLRIDDATISSQHARLTFRQNQWWVEDLDSTNGSFLNEVLIEEPMVITSRDTLRCGRILLQIKIEPQPIRKLSNK